MNLFNRIAVTVVLIFLILLSVGVTFVTVFIPLETLNSARTFLSSLTLNINVFSQALVAIPAIVLAVAFFLLLLWELNPQKQDGVVLSQVKSGSATLSIESVVQRVRKSAEQVLQVIRAEPFVSSRGKAVDIKIDLFLDPAADVAAKTEEVAQAVHSAVETGLGVKVHKVDIKVKHDLPSTLPAPKS